jgi:transposase
MGAKRRQFTREFKLEAVRLVSESEQTLAEVARELGIRADILRRWVEEAASRTGLEDGMIFPGNGQQEGPEAENRRLRRELELVRQERDFLKKAAAYFAKESR